MAHKKAGGSANNLKDSNAQRLGVKLYDGQVAKPGAIIVRQRGTKVRPSINVRKGKDDTLFATAAGKVKFFARKVRKYDSSLEQTKFVKIVPEQK